HPGHATPSGPRPTRAPRAALDADGVPVEVLDPAAGLADDTLLQPREVHPADETSGLVVDRDLRFGCGEPCAMHDDGRSRLERRLPTSVDEREGERSDLREGPAALVGEHATDVAH